MKLEASLEAPLETCQAVGVPSKPPSMGRLFLISSAALYLEIVLIRWLGTKSRSSPFFRTCRSLYVSWDSALGAFFSSKKRGSLLPSLAATTALVIFVYLPFQSWRDCLRTMSSVLSYTPDAALWGWLQVRLPTATYYELLAQSLAIVCLFLMLLAVTMIPLGRWVGYYLETARNTVAAYSVNLLGSLVGTWLLAVLAFLWIPPWCWFLAAFLLIVLAQPLSLALLPGSLRYVGGGFAGPRAY